MADENSLVDPIDQEKLVHDVMDALPDPVFLVDDERRLIYSNTESANITDTRHSGRDLAVSFRHPAILEAVDTVLKTGSRENAEVSLSAPLNQTFQALISPMNLPERLRPGALILLRDMTSLQTADQMRQDFVANVSHELRSPIASLFGFIETLRESAKDDPKSQEKFLGIMADEAARMSRLIDDLLSLSRIEVSEHVLPSGTVDIPIILDLTAELLRGRAEERGMQIVIDRPAKFGLVRGDKDELIEVFQNLLENAIKYGTLETAIDVKISEVERLPDSDKPGIAVSIFNRCQGITPEHLPRLTERFYRVDEGRSRNIGGTGLGLAIVKHIISRHRGHMDIDSRDGVGVTVTVYLSL